MTLRLHRQLNLYLMDNNSGITIELTVHCSDLGFEPAYYFESHCTLLGAQVNTAYATSLSSLRNFSDLI